MAGRAGSVAAVLRKVLAALLIFFAAAFVYTVIDSSVGTAPPAPVVSHPKSAIQKQGAEPGLDADKLQALTADDLLGRTVQWSQLTSFPTACPAGQFVRGVGTSLACGSP